MPTAKPANTQPAPPNIVIILADDLGYGDIGPYGQTKAETPNLDQLAREGVRFTQHYAGSTVCAPSRAVLMTGQHTGNTHIRGNWELGDYTDEGERGQMPLAEGRVTLPAMLQQRGYRTALIGKWGLGMQGTPGDPMRQGFDYAFGYLDQKQAHNYYPTHLWENGVRYPLRNRFFIPHISPDEKSKADEIFTKYQGEDYAPDHIIRKAESFIEAQNKNKPFFLYYASTIPHAALQIPKPLLSRYVGRFPEKALDRTNYTPHPTPRAARAAMVTRLDDEVGRIRAALARAGLADNTLIIFTSDNGPTAEGGSDIDFFGATGGLRGAKRDLYEGGIRVPLVAYWAGKTKPGATVPTISASWDLLPTLANVAGASSPDAIDGRSFLPALVGQPQYQTGPLYWEFHEKAGPAQAVRDGKWKAIRFQPSGFDPLQPLELYDLDADPRETRDVAAGNPAIVARMSRMLDARTRSPVPGYNFDPEKRQLPKKAILPPDMRP